MPEGDSLHRAAARLRPLVGERVEASSPNPRGLATNVARAVDGRVLESVEAVGKHLLLRFEGGVTVRSHLRMNGRWRVRERGGPAWRGRAVARSGDAAVGGHAVERPGAEARRRARGRLGPDLLADATTVEEVVARVRRADPDRLLGDVLLDQRVVAGIGNMWLAELLWQGRLSPFLPVGEVTDDELGGVLGWGRESMRGAVAGARPPRAVYRRAGRPCPRCGTPILSRGLGERNRTAYWCASCQRGP